jgi:predicted DNA-binding protein YlxM (UPF0122 family)
MAKDEMLLTRRSYGDQLYDLYAPLLTERQREAWEFHEFSDLSLAETAEAMGTSRQAVHELITRSRERLSELETLLSFHAKEKAMKDTIRLLRERLAEKTGRDDFEEEPEDSRRV